MELNIFVSSTCYDLSQVRKDLHDFILSLGCKPILSEHNDFPIAPQLDNHENCINNVKKYADIFILIIGDRYGSVGDTGKSITNLEYQAAIQKGIPVYTFALKQMIYYLHFWKRNPNADFSSIVDNNQIFKFLSDVRDKGGWNFEFENAQDIIEILRKQLSFLFKETLELRKKIVSSQYEDLYPKISSKALKIIIQKEDHYDLMFFMQVLQDGIQHYCDLKNDFKYAIILRPIHQKRNLQELLYWLQEKFEQIISYIDSLNKLSEAFKLFYKENNDESDLRGLYYISSTYAEFYANLLRWGIAIKGVIIPNEYRKLMELLSEMPSPIITEMENYPKEAMSKISKVVENIKDVKLEKKDLIQFPFKITIPDKLISAFKKELEILKA